jgi:hypothetical protein
MRILIFVFLILSCSTASPPEEKVLCDADKMGIEVCIAMICSNYPSDSPNAPPICKHHSVGTADE